MQQNPKQTLQTANKTKQTLQLCKPANHVANHTNTSNYENSKNWKDFYNAVDAQYSKNGWFYMYAQHLLLNDTDKQGKGTSEAFESQLQRVD